MHDVIRGSCPLRHPLSPEPPEDQNSAGEVGGAGEQACNTEMLETEWRGHGGMLSGPMSNTRSGL
ncbi:hypothetical protein N7470_000226 [Penicillium chermesinum]|nr:hypothetical protein N7470_000226 [Penicillium chermesinum]